MKTESIHFGLTIDGTEYSVDRIVTKYKVWVDDVWEDGGSWHEAAHVTYRRSTGEEFDSYWEALPDGDAFRWMDREEKRFNAEREAKANEELLKAETLMHERAEVLRAIIPDERFEIHAWRRMILWKNSPIIEFSHGRFVSTDYGKKYYPVQCRQLLNVLA